MFSSSVIRFTGFVDSSEESRNLETADALYRYINTEERFDEVEGYRTNSRDNSKTFVTVIGEGEGHTHDKVTSITLSVPYVLSDWYPTEEGHDAINVYLYMTYDVQLIECFMEEHTGGGISFDDRIYFFHNDMNKISVSYEK